MDDRISTSEPSFTCTAVRHHPGGTLVAVANVSSLVRLAETAGAEVVSTYGTSCCRRDTEAVHELLGLPLLDDRAVVPLTLLRQLQVTFADAAACSPDRNLGRRFAAAALLVDQVVDRAARA
ncbi:MAG: hypothetical protein R2737_16435 [Candidatus Nanopelagicales bacterium]